MSMVKLVDLNLHYEKWIYALIINEETDQPPANIVHVKPDNHTGETCAEYNRRILTEVGAAQGWCAACIDMLLGYMMVEWCELCKEEYMERNISITIGENGNKEYTQILPSNDSRPTIPDWWTLSDPDIQQLISVPQAPDVKARKPWNIWPKDTNDKVLTRLGLTCGCLMCLGMARAMVGSLPKTYNVDAKIAIKSFMPQFVYDQGLQQRRSEDYTDISLSWEWYRDRKSQPKLEYTGNLQIPVNVSQRPIDIVCDTRRFDVLFLKGQLESSFQEYLRKSTVSPENKDSQFPNSFRLIDVHKRCVFHIGNVHVKYSAISYRWNSNDMNMLTGENESQFMTPGFLSLSTMSRTLYDCMELARDLDIPYIWIDRYCIIQSHSFEKAEQIHAMGDIYANSWLTIICASDQDINSGLYGYSRSFGRPFLADEFDYVHGTIDRWRSFDMEYKPEWATRGWTLQEEHLSRRRLYMTDFTVAWHINCPTITYHHVAIGKPPEPRDECCSSITSSLHQILYASVWVLNPSA